MTIDNLGLPVAEEKFCPLEDAEIDDMFDRSGWPSDRTEVDPLSLLGDFGEAIAILYAPDE